MKFAVLKFKHILQIDPWKFWFFSNEVPGGSTKQGRGKGGRIPAMGMAGGEGKQGGKREGVRADLRVVSDGSGAAGRWVTGDEQGRRPWELGSGGLG